jgi:WD40 repeat protein
VAAYETAIVRLYSWAATRPTAGLGLLVGTSQLVTCAHVVNSALGRALHEQAQPGESDLVQVEFPQLPEMPVRQAQVVSWVPPPIRGGGGDVAGLVLTEDAPSGAAPARFGAAVREPGTRLRVFGYPGKPPREGGMWVDVDLKGKVGGQLLQVESRSDQTVKAQPGYSGSPVWDDSTGEAVGMLQSAPFADAAERDASLLAPLAIAQAWEEPFDYLLVPENPYRGLEPFTAEQATVFFGRDADIAALAAQVRAHPVVVVVGPSGAGKSSLVQAGLIPALQPEQQWSVALVRPGQDPWLRLAAGLLIAQHGREPVPTQEETERAVARLRAEGLGPVARFLRSQNRPLLVVVDQFEDVLATGESPDQDLLDLLLPPPGAADTAVRLVLTVRADFLPVLQSIAGFHIRLNERLYLLSPPTAEQMRQAVIRPARARGVGFEPGLADQILSDAADVSLPLLEFTLTKLWGTQRRRTLTFAGYHQMGGVRGALDRFANEKTVELTESAAEALDHVLLRLVRTSGGGSDLVTRQRVLKSQVAAAEWDILRRIADTRLVILGTNSADGEPYAELAHDSLITTWQRLRDLVADNAAFLNWLAWVQQRATEDDPLPEARIAEARRWADTRPDNIPDDIRRFIDSSQTAAEARLRELRDARNRAQEATARAEEAAKQAEARRLAAAAELALATPGVPLQVPTALAIESLGMKSTVEGDIAIRHAIRRTPIQLCRLDQEGPVIAVAFSPDGTRLATGSEDGSARVLNAATRAELCRLDHEGPVIAVAFSPDGTWVATGSEDGSARVLDAATGAELWRLDHEGPVIAVAFSEDGTRLATGSSEQITPFPQMRRGSAQPRRLGNDDPVSAVAPSPDLVATGNPKFLSWPMRGSARVLDAATGTELCRLDHHGPVRAVALSPDGTEMVTASGQIGQGGSARVLDATTSAELYRLDFDGPVCAIGISPLGLLVASVTGGEHYIGGDARVFLADSGARLCRMDHGDPVNVLAFSPDGTLVATGSGESRGRGGSVRVFDPVRGGELCRLDHEGPVRAVAFSPDGTQVAIASGHSVRVLDVTTEGELCYLDHEGPANAVAFSPDGTQLATGSSDHSARVLDAATGAELCRRDHEGPVNAVAFSPDGTQLATASGDHTPSTSDYTSLHSPDELQARRDDTARRGGAWLLDAATGAELCRLHDGPVNAVAFSPDGTRLATGSGDNGGVGNTRVLDAATGAELCCTARADQAVPWDLAFHLGNHKVNAVAFNRDGRRVASGIGDDHFPSGTVGMLDATTGTQLFHPAPFAHGGPVNAVAFSPDGTRLAIGCSDHSAQVFDAATGAELCRMDHEGPVNAVAFSPDGTRLATACSDRSAQVFDAATGAELCRMDHHGPVNAVAFSPDGTRLATASSDHRVRVWIVERDQLIGQAADRLNRNLTRQEWRRYFHDEPYRKTRADLPAPDNGRDPFSL